MNNSMTPDTALALIQQTGQDAAAKTAKRLNTAMQDKDIKAAEEAAQDFEAMFVSEMMKPMFEGIETDGQFGGGKGEEIFRGLLLEEYGKVMAQTGALGIADHVKQELIRMQAAQNNANDPYNNLTNAMTIQSEGETSNANLTE